MSRKTYPILYFAYGANTNVEHMKHRCPTAQYVGNATLHDHRLIFRSVADVIPVKGQNVLCALWEIRESDERSLDIFEGYPHHYVKHYADIRFNGKKRLAMFYVMAGGRRDRHEPPRSYEQTLREGYAQCGMDPTQIDSAIRDAKHSNERHLRYSGKWLSATERKPSQGKRVSDTDRLVAGITRRDSGLQPAVHRTQSALFPQGDVDRWADATGDEVFNDEMSRIERLRSVFPDYPDWFLNDMSFFSEFE